MAFKKYPAKKDPNSIVDYGRTWSNWLKEDEMISDSTWLITSEDEVSPTLVVSQQGSGIDLDGKTTAVWLEGGTAGVAYNLTNRIITDQQRTEDRTGIVTVEEK